MTDERRDIQESEYEYPYHWMLRRNTLRYYNLRTEIVLSMLGPLAGKAVLDIGCGDGRFTSALVKAGAARVAGIDISERALRFARALVPEGEFLLANGRTLDFPDGAFDAVTSLEVIEHIPPDAMPGLIAEIARVLKPGGRLCLSTREPKHYRHWTPDALDELFANRGFDDFSCRGLALHIPLLHRLNDFPILWKWMGFMIAPRNPRRAKTLIWSARRKA